MVAERSGGMVKHYITKELNEILDLPMTENDSGGKTLREYFQIMLQTVWDEGESFSGKRPFGNSGWRGDVELHFLQHGLIAGEVEDEEYPEVTWIDTRTMNNLVEQLIRVL